MHTCGDVSFAGGCNDTAGFYCGALDAAFPGLHEDCSTGLPQWATSRYTDPRHYCNYHAANTTLADEATRLPNYIPPAGLENRACATPPPRRLARKP